MTICVRIQNTDQRPDTVARVRACDADTRAVQPHGLNVELRAGESRDVYIHKGVALIVEEELVEGASPA